MLNNDIAVNVRLILRNVVGLSEASLQQDELALVGEGGGVDSVGVLRLVMALEKQFGIIVKDEEIHPDNLRSLSALIAFVERKVGR